MKKYPSIKQDVLDLAAELIIDPTQGEPLGKDCYKIRMAISSKNKGKSGGSRVITCVKIIDETVILLSIYDKSEQEDIDDKALNKLLKDNDLL
ncbi:MAG: type II toxin-antitoxin system RelE/ParE family toxin [Arcicella sp.]|nr:type II toxin-antitoxin system RelE/ParE family toxin [Arcicella sp.]